MAIGDIMPAIVGMIPCFEDDFSSGLAKWPNTKYPWARETVINGEQQYYADQSSLATADKTVFINSAGNLVLRCMDTPSYLVDEAKVVLNGYVVTQILNANQVMVIGENYYDRNTYANAVGIGWNREPSGFMRFPGRAQQTYSQIQDTIDSSGNPAHIITTADGIPSDLVLNDTNYRLNIFRRQPYISGIVTSQNTQANGNSGYSQKFGRWKFRVKAPRGQFCFPAAWLWRDYEEINGISYTTAQKGPEFDVWEILGHAPDISYHTLHSPGFNMRPSGSPLLGTYQGVEQWKTSSMQQFQRINAARDYSSDFFWVAFDWFTDNTCAWYVETAPNSGQLIEVANAKVNPTADDGIIDEAMMILNNAYMSDWSWYQSNLFDVSYSRFVGPTAPPWDYEISDVVVEKYPSQQTGSTSVTEKTYTSETVIGPIGTIDDVVICVPTHETDRQGKVHEVEAKIAYRPVNIPADKIGITWAVSAPPPIVPVFADGNDKGWRVRIHLTTVDTTPLAAATDIQISIASVVLLP